MISNCNEALNALWILETMAPFKVYANDVENELNQCAHC